MSDLISRDSLKKRLITTTFPHDNMDFLEFINREPTIQQELTAGPIKIGTYTIEPSGKDYIKISGQYKQMCMISGGDFESVLSAMCAAY